MTWSAGAAGWIGARRPPTAAAFRWASSRGRGSGRGAALSLVRAASRRARAAPTLGFPARRAAGGGRARRRASRPGARRSRADAPPASPVRGGQAPLRDAAGAARGRLRVQVRGAQAPARAALRRARADGQGPAQDGPARPGRRWAAAAAGRAPGVPGRRRARRPGRAPGCGPPAAAGAASGRGGASGRPRGEPRAEVLRAGELREADLLLLLRHHQRRLAGALPRLVLGE